MSPRSGRALLGIDFDNTIVCYDGLMGSVAVARGLVPADSATTKERVRDELRAAGREDDWTELQGWVYGPGMAQARPYPGALEFMGRARRAGHDVAIISHRTRFPYRGPRHDLHLAAREWLARHDVTDMGLATIDFEETKQAKLDRIVEVGCTHFVDDLPEFLAEPRFPGAVHRVLFDPHGSTSAAASGFDRLAHWDDAERVLGLGGP